jgi:cell division protein FtsW
MSQVKGPGYQVVQSLIGLHAGHIFGTGLGSSSIKWGFLPNDYTDFIFSIIGQELGLIGSLVVLGLFAYLSFLGIKVAKNARDNYQMLLASGITAWLSFQAFINIGAATGGLPVTGIPLPFVSYGGTQIIISMAAVGIMVNIARQSKLRSSGSSVSSVEKETKRGDKYLVKSGI